MPSFEVLPLSRTFELYDEGGDHDFSSAWTKEATDDWYALLPDGVAVATSREDEEVPVEVEVADARPEVDLDDWNHVVEAGFEVKSGRIVLEHEGVSAEEAPRIDVPAGPVAALLLYGKLGSAIGRVTGGEDHYRVVLWPGRIEEPRVVKRWQAD